MLRLWILSCQLS